jgi:eukaryotic-like serine/threonine-protein kinase
MQSRIIDGKYEIVRELSKGGMGAVYEARHLLTRRRVALKLILAETLARKNASDALRRFEREARAAGLIESRHVVSVLDTGVDASTNDNYIVMELLSGEDFRQLFRRLGRVPSDLVLSIAFQVCLGLRRAHEQGIIHRDIKAGNIFLARRDDGHVEVKILDFGIAKLRVDPLASHDGHDLTRSGSVLGSPLYMSPEQATGSRKIDGRSDIWSLGIVMYEALTGVTPHGNQALGAVILAICSEPARPIREHAPEVSLEVAALVHKALALEPSQRFASAAEMQAAIEVLVPGGGAIHESVLGAIPAGSVETGSYTPPGDPDSTETPPAQTTVDAVTYGSGAGKAAGTVPPRPATRRALLVGGGVVLAVGIGLWREAANVPATDANTVVSSTAVAAAETRALPPVAPPPPARTAIPLQTTENPVPSSTPSAAEPRRRAPARPARAIQPPASSSGLTPPSPNPPPTPAPASPPAGAEPAIDRRFD